MSGEKSKFRKLYQSDTILDSYSKQCLLSQSKAEYFKQAIPTFSIVLQVHSTIKLWTIHSRERWTDYCLYKRSHGVQFGGNWERNYSAFQWNPLIFIIGRSVPVFPIARAKESFLRSCNWKKNEGTSWRNGETKERHEGTKERHKEGRNERTQKKQRNQKRTCASNKLTC